MNSEKLGSSETSSEETDQQEVQDESSGTRRSYECIFCKRGFTNAQALGGHMNIHRKDRAKAKQVTPNSPSFPSRFSNEESMMTSPFISETNHPSQPSWNYSILEAQRNYNMYFQPPSSNPRNSPAAYAHQYEFLNPIRSPHQSFNWNQELLGANLSLQIGPSHVEDSEIRRGIQNDGEVDLELRLGHDPC